MGCGPAPKKQQMEKRESPVGILRVTILGTQFFTQEKYQKPNLKVRVSNQVFQTQYVAPPHPENKAGQTFTYSINSFYKPHGRVIEVGFFDGSNLISFGGIDANPSIDQRLQTQTRCILNRQGQKQKQHGYVLLRSTFEQLPYHDITFRFQQATIRRKTGSCGQDNVATRLTIGEQCLETQFLPDSLKNPPMWADHKYNFKVPDGVKRGFLQLVDDRNNTIGSAQLNLDDYTQVKQGDQMIQTQTLFYKEGDHQINAADLKYSFIAGKYADFKPRSEMVTSVLRAIRPQNQFSQSRLNQSNEQ